MSSLSSTSASSSGSIADPATDLPTVWVPLSAEETESEAGQRARKRDVRRWIATALFFVGGLALLALLIIIQFSKF
jgi:hypothetical protein